VKNLVINYNGLVLFEGSVDELQFAESANGVSVAGKFGGVPAKKSGSSSANFLELLTSSSKQKTDSVIQEKRRDLPSESNSD